MTAPADPSARDFHFIAIRQVIDGMVMAADRGDWPVCRACFTDQIDLDHEGAPRETRCADDVMASWAALFGRLTFSQHMVTNHVIDLRDGEAECASYVMVTHAIQTADGRRAYTQQGSYRHTMRLIGGVWLISGVTYRRLYDEGDETIMHDERAAGGQLLKLRH